MIIMTYRVECAKEMVLLYAILLLIANCACSHAAACNDTDIRLLGGRSKLEGRVEVCFRENRIWGTLCDDLWDWRDAMVACRQLGVNPEYAAPINSDSGIFGSGTVHAWTLNAICLGNETNLNDCIHMTVGRYNHICSHRQDAGVICLQAAVCNNTDIRLVGGRDHLEGRVEVCFQGQWGTVCDNYWDTRDAVVACRQLGLSTQYAAAINVHSNVFTRGIGPIFLRNVNCKGNETNLFECSHKKVEIYEYCSHSEDAGVICPQDVVCNDTDIRLVGGGNNLEGRVEVCFQGQWGTVCNNYWDTSDAMVVCRQLGLNTEYASAINVDRSNFGHGVGPIFLNNVGCIGNETTLDNCTHNGIRIHEFCSHSEDAGVRCFSTSTLTAGVVGGLMGGALIILVLVVIIAAVVVQRKKAKTQRSLAHGMNQQDSRIENGDACITLPQKEDFLKDHLTADAEESLSVPNPYSQHNPSALLHLNASTGRLHRVGSNYIRQLSERMLISQKNIKLLKTIGEGEFGIVYKAQLGVHPSLKIVAVKTLKGFFDQNEINKIMEESVKMKRFNHPNVMNLIGVCIDAGPAPYIVMPFMANGSLLSYLRKERPNLLLDENADEDLVLEVKKRLTVMCSQIASGMEYLTKESFIHRDLATRNCMIDAHFVIKITDFGLSEDVYARNYFRQGQETAVKLPVKWMAPESLQDGVFSDKTDVWSFGITCWEIFSGGITPYPGVDPPALVQLLKNGHRLSRPDNSACPEEMYSFMLKCWNSDPKERPSFSALVNSISGFAEKTAGYLDVSNYNPFEANVSTATPGEENGDMQTEGKPAINVLFDNPPVEINVQCPSEDESPCDDSLL